MNRYEMLEKLGDGSFGEVSRARSLKTGEVVAVKKIKALFPTWEECLQLRELKSLRVLRHENIVQLKEVIRDKEELYFVFEYMQTSLFRLMRNLNQQASSASSSNSCSFDDAGIAGDSTNGANSAPWLSETQIRSIMYQLFSGLAHMHKHGFFHRDIKPENLLCHHDTLKLADLGQAREIRSLPPYTDYVATRWYRAPELLLRASTYNSPIDLWACGCILVELFTRSPLFPGSSEADQFVRICKVLGTPTKENWPEGVSMASHMQFRFPKCAAVPWKCVLPPETPSAALQLVQDLLQYDPSRRITAAQALQHRFFDQNVERPLLTTTSPSPSEEVEVPVLPLSLSLRSEAKVSTATSGYTSSARRPELPDWAAKARPHSHSQHKDWSSSLLESARELLDDDVRADAKATALGSSRIEGLHHRVASIRKSSSSRALANETGWGFPSARRRGLELDSDVKASHKSLAAEDDAVYRLDRAGGRDKLLSSSDRLLQELLDEFMG